MQVFNRDFKSVLQKMIHNAGQKFQDKLALLRTDLTKNKVAGVVVNMLDELAWLFNLRGSDVEFNPGRTRSLSYLIYCLKVFAAVFFAYAFVTHESAILFVDKDQVDDDILAHLGSEVEIRPYDEFFDYLKKYGKDSGKEKVYLPSNFVFTNRHLIYNIAGNTYWRAG